MRVVQLITLLHEYMQAVATEVWSNYAKPKLFKFFSSTSLPYKYIICRMIK